MLFSTKRKIIYIFGIFAFIRTGHYIRQKVRERDVWYRVRSAIGYRTAYEATGANKRKLFSVLPIHLNNNRVLRPENANF